MNIPKWQAVFFDFDGVIADSVRVKTTAFAAMFEPYGQEVVSKVLDYHLANGGMPRFKKFEYYLRELLHREPSPELLDQLGSEFSSRVVDGVIASSLITGAKESLKELKHHGIPAFIVSGTPHEEMLTIAEQKELATYFLEIHGSPRNKTEILQDILKRRSYRAEECLFIGDALADHKAAADTGMQFLGIAAKESRVPFPPGTPLSPVVTLVLPITPDPLI